MGGVTMRIEGRARVLPDLVNTDLIISSRRKRDQSDPRLLVCNILEDLEPPLAEPLAEGDIIVAGHGFGCGSAMEMAVDVLIAAGIGCVVARSYARTFYRNAIGVGLPVLELTAGEVVEGDLLSVTYGRLPTVENQTRGDFLVCAPVPGLAVTVVRSGGLLEYVRTHGTLARGNL